MFINQVMHRFRWRPNCHQITATWKALRLYSSPYMIVDLLPTAKPECHFSSDVIGEWVFFETDRKEKATITSGHVKLEALGEYVCKSKHWNINYYKVLSYYSNGWLDFCSFQSFPVSAWK